MKKFTFIILIAAAAIAFWFWRDGRARAMASEQAAASAETIAVWRGNVAREVISSATITPENKLEIKSPIAGRAESVLVDIGQEVKRGQPLAMMSSSERAALLDAARAKGAGEVKFWEDVYKAAPLVAPLDGVIISRTLVPGQVVTTSDVAFIMSDHLIAQASMDETDIAKVRMGQPATVTLDSYPESPIEGEVSKIAYNGVTSNNVTTYPVNVTMKNIPDFARSGMTANVGFIEEVRTNVLLLPVDAVSPDGAVQVMSHEPGAGVVSRRVTTGLSDGKNIEITGGVSEGQQVLRTIYQLPEQKQVQGVSLLPRPERQKRATGTNAPPRETPPQ